MFFVTLFLFLFCFTVQIRFCVFVRFAKPNHPFRSLVVVYTFVNNSPRIDEIASRRLVGEVFFYRKEREIARKECNFLWNSEKHRIVSILHWPLVPKNISVVTDRIPRYKSRILTHKLRVYFHKYRGEFRRQRKREKGENEDRSGYTVEPLYACPRRQQIASTTRLVYRAPLIDDGRANLFFPRFSILHHSSPGCRRIFLFYFRTTTLRLNLRNGRSIDNNALRVRGNPKNETLCRHKSNRWVN